jgi:hypothetical protein
VSLYFPDAELIFVHIPKTAGSSFKNWCNHNGIDYHNDHCHSTWLMAQQRWPTAQHAVTFVRNPYDRMVSMFMYVGQRAELRQHRRDRGNGKIKKHTTAQQDQQLVEIYQRGFRSWIQDLGRGLSSVYEVTGGWYDRTYNQHSWLEGCDRCQVIRMEEIDQRFVWLQSILRCQHPLPQDNCSVHSHYREYYDTETRDIVTSMFQQDIERFDYAF